jgi:hypothetical protein
LTADDDEMSACRLQVTIDWDEAINLKLVSYHALHGRRTKAFREGTMQASRCALEGSIRQISRLERCFSTIMAAYESAAGILVLRDRFCALMAMRALGRLPKQLSHVIYRYQRE